MDPCLEQMVTVHKIVQEAVDSRRNNLWKAGRDSKNDPELQI